MTSQLTLSEKDVQQIILKYLKDKGLNPVGVPSINVGLVSTGFGSAERDEPGFKNITIDIEPIIKIE